MANANTALDIINFQYQGKAKANTVRQTSIAIDTSARILDTRAMDSRSFLLSKSCTTERHYYSNKDYWITIHG